MYESHDSMPWDQSEDLNFDAARAEWERGQDQSAAYASYTAEVADAPYCDVCEREPARLCEHSNLRLCDDCADTDEHREYCEMIQDGGGGMMDTPEQIARASIAAYREYTERYGQSPDEATEATVREVLEGLAVDVEAVRAEMAEHPGPTPAEMEGWPL